MTDKTKCIILGILSATVIYGLILFADTIASQVTHKPPVESDQSNLYFTNEPLVITMGRLLVYHTNVTYLVIHDSVFYKFSDAEWKAMTNAYRTNLHHVDWVQIYGP